MVGVAEVEEFNLWIQLAREKKIKEIKERLGIDKL